MSKPIELVKDDAQNNCLTPQRNTQLSNDAIEKRLKGRPQRGKKRILDYFNENTPKTIRKTGIHNAISLGKKDTGRTIIVNGVEKPVIRSMELRCVICYKACTKKCVTCGVPLHASIRKGETESCFAIFHKY